MSKLKKLFLNKGSSIAYAIITAIFTVLPEDCFKVVTVSASWPEAVNVLIIRLIVCATVFMGANIGYSIYKRRRQKVSIAGKNYSIQIEYGDLLSITGGKIVINFDECFTTNVGEGPADIKPASVCGQYLKSIPLTICRSYLTRLALNRKEENRSLREWIGMLPGPLFRTVIIF